MFRLYVQHLAASVVALHPTATSFARPPDSYASAIVDNATLLNRARASCHAACWGLRAKNAAAYRTRHTIH